MAMYAVRTMRHTIWLRTIVSGLMVLVMHRLVVAIREDSRVRLAMLGHDARLGRRRSAAAPRLGIVLFGNFIDAGRVFL